MVLAAIRLVAATIANKNLDSRFNVIDLLRLPHHTNFVDTLLVIAMSRVVLFELRDCFASQRLHVRRRNRISSCCRRQACRVGTDYCYLEGALLLLGPNQSSADNEKSNQTSHETPLLCTNQQLLEMLLSAANR